MQSKESLIFLKKGIFFIFLGGIIIKIFFLLPFNFILKNPSDSYLIRWNEFYKKNTDSEIIVLGSSRAHRHYDTEVISKYFQLKVENISMAGAGIDLQEALFKDYVKINKNPKLVILNLDPSSFNRLGIMPNPVSLIPYFTKGTHLSNVNSDNLMFKWRDYGYLLYKDKLIYKILYPDTVKHKNGFLPRDILWNDDFEKFKEEFPEGKEFAIDIEDVRRYSDFINYLTISGIEVILCYSPEYYQVWDFQLNRDEIKKTAYQLAELNNITILDFSIEEFEINYKKENFFNSQHLNTKGSREFSLILCDSIDHLNLKSFR